MAAVFGFSILNRLTPDREFSSQENRILEQRPALRLSSLADGTYMKKYETYQSDQFAGRDAWIEVSTGMEYLLGRRDSGGVFKGEDHYLLEKIESDEGDNVQDNIEAVRSFAEGITSGTDPLDRCMRRAGSAPGRRNLLPHRSPLDQSGSLVRVSGSKKSYGAE